MKVLPCALMLFAALSAQAGTFAPVVEKPAVASSSSAAVGQTHPQGRIESAVNVADPMFGVHANVLGLERRVEMLQWRKAELPAPTHYEQVWSAESIDSSTFDSAHRNSGDLPFNGERWWSPDPKLDGHPVSAEVMSALDAWTPLQPDLSQLPTNLAVSFQPDGDWLSTSQDPAHPQIGDVRVRWHAIMRAVPPAGTVLVSGRWEIPATVAAVAGSTLKPVTPEKPSPARDLHAWAERMFGDRLPWWIAGGVVLALLLLVWRRRR